MFDFISKYFAKKTNSIESKHPKISSKQDVEFAFKMHDMVKAINNSSNEDKLKSLETLKRAGHISESEFLEASRSIARN
jgi:hypothetical protein